MNNKITTSHSRSLFTGSYNVRRIFIPKNEKMQEKAGKGPKTRRQEMGQDREFYIMWCAMLSGDAESYYAKLPDQALEAKYNELLGRMEQEIKNEGS